MPDARYHPLVKAAAGALKRRCGVRERDHLLVAVSGGADSVALLRALASLRDRRRWRLKLTVAHADHRLRPTSGDDEAFVQTLAQQLGCDCRTTRLDLQPGNVEAAAREARYRWLEEVADDCHAGAIATAHHSDDQLETLLMRMMRGASIAGLAAMDWRRGRIIRPLLATDQATILDYLQMLNQTWCEDESNANTTLQRNRLRHDVLPVLRELRADVAGKAVELTDHLRAAADYFSQQVDAHTPAGNTLKRRDAGAMHPLLLAGVLRAMLQHAGVDSDRLDRSTLDDLVRAARDHHGGQRHFNLANKVSLVLTRDEINIQS